MRVRRLVTLDPEIDGLQTFYPTDPSDRIFGPNPMSRMSVVNLKVSYDACFATAPSVGSAEEIEAANRAAISGLNLSDPRMEWKGGIGGGWFEMWSPRTVGLPMPPSFEPAEPFKALDVAAWNNNQLQYLPDYILATLPGKPAKS
jgi:hypothetical protein